MRQHDGDIVEREVCDELRESLNSCVINARDMTAIQYNILEVFTCKTEGKGTLFK